MMTINEIPAADHTRYIAAHLAPDKVRHGALSVLASQKTPETLRTAAVAACPDLTPVWNAWADEAEALAACGFGGPAREAAKLALVTGVTAAQYRDPRAYPGEAASKRRARAIADEMDALLAEGFDTEIFVKQIDRVCGAWAPAGVVASLHLAGQP